MRLRMTPPFFGELTEALTNAVAYHIKWNTRRSDGDTRAEYYTKFGQADQIPQEPDLPH